MHGSEEKCKILSVLTKTSWKILKNKMIPEKYSSCKHKGKYEFMSI